jgi:hypothetical protein
VSRPTSSSSVLWFIPEILPYISQSRETIDKQNSRKFVNMLTLLRTIGKDRDTVYDMFLYFLILDIWLLPWALSGGTQYGFNVRCTTYSACIKVRIIIIAKSLK